MKLIVDASVAVKWWFTEQGSVESRQLLAHRIVLYAPDFILTEAANVLWKKARRKEIADPQPYLEELARLPDVVVLCPSSDLVDRATGRPSWSRPRNLQPPLPRHGNHPVPAQLHIPE